jgi:L1 cell adhesion molecule like protein
MEGNIFAPVVPRGQTVPTIKKRTFTTVAGQSFSKLIETSQNSSQTSEKK